MKISCPFCGSPNVARIGDDEFICHDCDQIIVFEEEYDDHYRQSEQRRAVSERNGRRNTELEEVTPLAFVFFIVLSLLFGIFLGWLFS